MVTVTDDGLPARTDDGSAPKDTVNVSSSSSASCAVVTSPVPVVEPLLIVMPESEPKSPDSAVPAVSVSGIVTLLPSAPDSRAVTVTRSPSSTGFGDADRLTVGDGASVSVTEKLCAVVDRSTPPPTLVLRLARSRPLALVSSGPSATVSVSPPLSAAPSSVTPSSSVATCTVLVASVPEPVKRTTGARVPAFTSVTPVPALSARSSRSAAVTPVPDSTSGTSITSPAISLRPSVTLNSISSPSATPPTPTRARDATVGSSSTMVTVAVVVLESVTPAGSGLSGSAESTAVTTSLGSSTLSSAPETETPRSDSPAGTPVVRHPWLSGVTTERPVCRRKLEGDSELLKQSRNRISDDCVADSVTVNVPLTPDVDSKSCRCVPDSDRVAPCAAAS